MFFNPTLFSQEYMIQKTFIITSENSTLPALDRQCDIWRVHQTPRTKVLPFMLLGFIIGT